MEGVYRCEEFMQGIKKPQQNNGRCIQVRGIHARNLEATAEQWKAYTGARNSCKELRSHSRR